MLYFFKVLDSPYFKFGWTEQANPWNRIQTGFWTNLHPKQLCQKLGPENLELIYLFHGGKDFEGVIKSLFPPVCANFGTRRISKACWPYYGTQVRSFLFPQGHSSSLAMLLRNVHAVREFYSEASLASKASQKLTNYSINSIDHTN